MSQQATQQHAADEDFEGQVDDLVQNGMEPVQAGANPDQLNELFGLTGKTAALDVPKGLQGKSAPALRKIINDAVQANGIDASWKATGNDTDDLISQINDLCNEHHLTVSDSGALVAS